MGVYCTIAVHLANLQKFAEAKDLAYGRTVIKGHHL